MTNKAVAFRIALFAALMIFGFALVPVAFGDKGGAPNGGNGGSGNGGGVATTASTSTTSTSTASTTTTTTSTGNGRGGGKGGGGAKSGGSGGSTPITTTLSMTAEYISWPATWEPDCMTEDDSDQRIFSGSLNGSYGTSYRLCDLNTDGWTAGGIGLESDVYVVGQLSDLTITAPDGSVHQAVLMGQSTSQGVTTSHYAVCFVPTYYISTDTGTNPLQGGTWLITLSGQISSAAWTTIATMTDATFQESYCPTSEQNLLP